METKNVYAERRRVKWSRGERGLVWTSGVLLVLAIAAFVWNSTANDLPNINIPTPTLPSPNAYDYYVKAGQQGVGNPIEQSKKPTPQEMVAALPPNLPALKTFREGMEYPYLNPPVRSFSTLNPQYATLRKLARLLLLEGQVYEIQGNYGGAAQTYLDCLRLGQDVPRGGSLITFLVGTACEAIGRRNFWGLTEKLSATEARTAVKRLEELNATRYPFADTMQEEKWLGQAGFLEILRKENAFGLTSHLYGSMMPKASVEYWRTSFSVLVRGKKRIFQDYSTFMDVCIIHARQPYSPNVQPPSLPDDPIIAALFPVFEQAQIKDWDAQMQNALLTATLALRAYQQEKRDYPTSLDALVAGGYLTRVPDDPFAGTGPLRYKRVSANKYILYSVGPDGKDDGGKPIDVKTNTGNPKRWAEADMVGDFVAREYLLSGDLYQERGCSPAFDCFVAQNRIARGNPPNIRDRRLPDDSTDSRFAESEGTHPTWFHIGYEKTIRQVNPAK